MARFVINVPIETQDPRIEVEVDPANPLRLGRHRFQLVVVDDSGNQSVPDVVTVRVIDNQNPTADLTAPETVPFGTSFPLSGVDSSDVGGGRIARYIWTYLGPVPVPVPVGPGGPVPPGPPPIG